MPRGGSPRNRRRRLRHALLGQSDGAGIALIVAGSGAVHPDAVGVIAPHLSVVPVCLDGIRAISVARESVTMRLGRHHDHRDLVFDRWPDIWLDPAFPDWTIADVLLTISCPVLAAQGDRDEYSTSEMIDGLARAVLSATGRFFEDRCHVAHRDQPELVLTFALELAACARSNV